MIEETSFVLDVLNGDEWALELVSIAESERRPGKVSSITHLQLYGGIGQSTRPEAEKVEGLDVLDSKTLVAADEGILRRGGELSVRLIVVGEPLDPQNCIAGATALR